MKRRVGYRGWSYRYTFHFKFLLFIFLCGSMKNTSIYEHIKRSIYSHFKHYIKHYRTFYSYMYILYMYMFIYMYVYIYIYVFTLANVMTRYLFQPKTKLRHVHGFCPTVRARPSVFSRSIETPQMRDQQETGMF